MNDPTKDTRAPDAHRPTDGALTQASFVEKSELQFKEWTSKLDVLAAQAEKLTAEAKAAAHKGIAELKPKLAAARQKLDATKTAASEKWPEAKAGLELLWSEVKALFEKHQSKPAS
jgi:hypothetical protein